MKSHRLAEHDNARRDNDWSAPVRPVHRHRPVRPVRRNGPGGPVHRDVPGGRAPTSCCHGGRCHARPVDDFSCMRRRRLVTLDYDSGRRPSARYIARRHFTSDATSTPARHRRRPRRLRVFTRRPLKGRGVVRSQLIEMVTWGGCKLATPAHTHQMILCLSDAGRSPEPIHGRNPHRD